MTSQDRTVVLVDLTGNPVQALVEGVSWRLEDRADSTSRLTVELPLATAPSIVSDMELVVLRRRFAVARLDADRSSGLVQVEADEVQVELASANRASYKLQGVGLEMALTMALAGTGWAVGDLARTGGAYWADFTDIVVADALTFLAQQSGLSVRFDSMRRKVSLVDPGGGEPGRVFTYGVGVAGIKKTEEPPTVTVLYPTGADGMTIENVNEGKPYIEDFSWYVNRGVPLDVARARFSKVEHWSDERYTWAGNLLTAARQRLKTRAYPAISYEVQVEGADAEGLSLGDPVWVVDSGLGVKVSAVVSAVVQTFETSLVDLVLGTLPETSDTSGAGDSTESHEAALFQVKNPVAVALGSTPLPVLRSSASVYTDTAFKVGVIVTVDVTTAGTLRGFFMLNGNRLDVQPSQTVGVGAVTWGLPFLISPVVAGETTFDLYMSIDGGAGSVGALRAEMYIEVRGAYGGMTHTRPDTDVQDFIPEGWFALAYPTDTVGVWVGDPVAVQVADAPSLTVSMAPTDNLVSWIPVPSWQVSGAVLTIWDGLPGQTFTLAASGGAGLPVVLDADGAGSWDLGVLFGLPPGTYPGQIVHTGVEFSFTVV